VFNEIEPDPVLNQTGFQMPWDISSTGGSTKLNPTFRTAPEVLSNQKKNLNQN
jgi:hypothetical protein